MAEVECPATPRDGGQTDHILPGEAQGTGHCPPAERDQQLRLLDALPHTDIHSTAPLQRRLWPADVRKMRHGREDGCHLGPFTTGEGWDPLMERNVGGADLEEELLWVLSQAMSGSELPWGRAVGSWCVQARLCARLHDFSSSGS